MKPLCFLLFVASLVFCASALEASERELWTAPSALSRKIDPHAFSIGISEAVFGWTYPKFTELCLQKNSALLSNYFSFLYSVMTLQFGDAYTKLSAIYENYLTYPRCNVLTNVPTTAVLYFVYHKVGVALND